MWQNYGKILFSYYIREMRPFLLCAAYSMTGANLTLKNTKEKSLNLKQRLNHLGDLKSIWCLVSISPKK